MGASMARRLLGAGFTVSVFNRSAARCDALVQMGARRATSPREAADGADIVISMVTDSPDAEAVLCLGPDAAIRGAAAGTLFIDMSTIAPDAARRIGAALVNQGGRFLDAPVTGGDIGARDGTLSILVGGAVADLERARPVFTAMGKRITHCGPCGAGQIMKACNQILCALNLMGVTEALNLAVANGLNPQVMVDALGAGAGGSWALEKLGPRIVAQDFDPGFMVKLIQKDLRIVQEVAKAVGLPLAGTDVAQALFADNENHGEGNLGTQVMYRAVHRRRRT